MNIELRNALRYAAEMGGAVALLAGAKWLGHQGLGPAGGLLPILPIWLLLWVSVRHSRRIAEYQRLRFLQSAALSAGILLCVGWSYTCAQAVFALPPQPQDPSWYFSIIFIAVTLVVN